MDGFQPIHASLSIHVLFEYFFVKDAGQKAQGVKARRSAQVCGLPWPWPFKSWFTVPDLDMVQQRSGRWVLAAIGARVRLDDKKKQHQVLIFLLLLGRSPKEGRYTFRKLDQNSGLVLDGGEEVAPGLTIWWVLV